MSLDPEIESISKCHDALKTLDDEAKKRVIQWLVNKYELSKTSFSHVIPEPQKQSGNLISTSPAVIDIPNPMSHISIEDYDDLAEFFAILSPSSDWEKALIVATFLQVKNGLGDFKGFDVNKKLKNLGHGVSNIASTLTACIDKKPQLILQLRKEGKSKQAQKKYKVSTEGINYVKKLLQNLNS